MRKSSDNVADKNFQKVVDRVKTFVAESKVKKIEDLKFEDFEKVFEELLGEKKAKKAKEEFKISFDRIKNNKEINDTQKQKKLVNKINELMETKKGLKTRNIVLALATAVLIAIGAKVYFDNNKVVASEEAKAEQSTPQGNTDKTKNTKDLTANFTNSQNKTTDANQEPTEGGGDDPKDGENPENPEQKDTIKTENRKPEGELRAKAEINEEEMDFGDDLSFNYTSEESKKLDKTIVAIDEETTQTQKVEKNLDNENAEIDKRLETKRAEINRLKGEKGE